MTDYGIKVSKPGKDVKSAGVDDLVFSSEYHTRSIYNSGSSTLSTDSDADWDTLTIDHDLGYKPMVKIFITLHRTSEYVEIPGVYRSYSNDSDCVLSSGVPEYVERFKVEITDNDVIVYAKDTLECVIPMVGTTYTYYAHDYTVDYIVFMEEIGL